MSTVSHYNKVDRLAAMAVVGAPKPRAGWIDRATAQEMLDLTLEAIRKALSSGTKKYNIGSRGLERYALEDLYKMLDFWREQIEDLLAGGTSIKSKRARPYDG
jgi:hypothetical protein